MARERKDNRKEQQPNRRGNKESRVSKVSRNLIDRFNPQPDETGTSLARRGELIGLITLMMAVAFAAALLTFDPNDLIIVKMRRTGAHPLNNALGPVGVRIGHTLFQFLGVAAFAFVGLVGTIGLRTLMGKTVVPSPRTLLASFGATIGALMLTHICCSPFGVMVYGHNPAGYFGTLFASLFTVLISTLGATLLASTILMLSVSSLTRRPLVRLLFQALGARGARIGEMASTQIAQQVDQTRKQLQQRRESRAEMKAAEQQAEQEAAAEREAYAEDAQPLVWNPDTGLHRAGESEADEDAAVALPDTRPSGLVAKAEVPENLPMGTPIIPREDLIPAAVRRASAVRQAPEPDQPEAPIAPPPEPRLLNLHRSVADIDSHTSPDLKPSSPTSITSSPEQAPEAITLPKAATIMGLRTEAALRAEPAPAPQAVEPTPVDEGREPMPTAPLPVVSLDAEADASGQRVPRIVKTAALSEPTAAPAPAEQGTLAIGDRQEWKLPPRFIVQSPPNRVVAAPQHVLVENARVLEQKLEDFNIKGEVTDIRPGPVVTTYEYKPAPGVKISKIVNLKDDLTMSLSALRVRVVAPIPGRDVVGIEVPNKQRQIVYFREVLESEPYVESKGKLTIILGKDIEGTPVVTNLAKAPHLLVAGATGTGKSVGINSFLASMLFKATPDDVKFIMIDPKVLELSIYEGIPHLLLPPIDEPHKAELALKWAVREMERRYRVLAGAKVRSISGYHAKMPELRDNARKKRVKVVDGKKRLVDANSPGAEHLAAPPEPEEMPYIVVVIDEFADLIMASGKEVERAVARLAQKARACGIHVILATQRPSTDVITGMIKANFPTRVSFQVASSIDSKVVLNSPGAESLLGMGDLLFLPPGSSHLKRCHGTWITDEEVASLAEHWKDQGSPNYDMSILDDPEAEKPEVVEEANRDSRFNEAVHIAYEAQQVSVSFLQRKMGIGYGRSARIVDQMEGLGLIGPARGPNKPREILMTGETIEAFPN